MPLAKSRAIILDLNKIPLICKFIIMIKFNLTPDFFVWRPIPYEEFLFVENVIDYKLESHLNTSVTVAGDEIQRLTVADIKDDQHEIYVVAGTIDGSNFGHFFWETVVYLRQFRQIKRIFPNVVFLVQEDKKFIKKIFDFYELKYDTKISKSKNYVGFLPPITPLITNANSLMYGDLLQSFHYELHRENKSVTAKDINILYIPRHKAGNYPYENMRSVEADSITDFLANKTNCLTLDTENNDDWGLEIEYTKKAKFIIVPDGSAYAVAGFHAHNSTIIVLGSYMTPLGYLKWDKVRLINQLICRNNKVFFVAAENKGNIEYYSIHDILPILERKIVSL